MWLKISKFSFYCGCAQLSFLSAIILHWKICNFYLQYNVLVLLLFLLHPEYIVLKVFYLKQSTIYIPLCQISFERGLNIKIVEEIPCSETLGAVCGKELEPGSQSACSAAPRADGGKGPWARVWQSPSGVTSLLCSGLCWQEVEERVGIEGDKIHRCVHEAISAFEEPSKCGYDRSLTVGFLFFLICTYAQALKFAFLKGFRETWALQQMCSVRWVGVH